jgi:hypothetical protein
MRRNRDSVAPVPSILAGGAAVPGRKVAAFGVVRSLLSLKLGIPPAAVRALWVSVAAVSGCLLYLDDINKAPTVMIEPPDVVQRGMPATFRAVLRDPDQDPSTLKLEWGAAPGACPAPAEFRAARSNGLFVQADRLVVPETMTDSAFCVWAQVTDRHGAHREDVKEASPANARPTARLDLVAPAMAASYPILTNFEVSAEGSVDPDGSELTYRFRIRRLGSPEVDVDSIPCPGDPGPAHICFSAGERDGQYRVEVFVSEDGGMTESATADLVVVVAPDAPPCIGVTMPAYGMGTLSYEPGLSHPFSVGTVLDDADPFPGSALSGGGTAGMRWYIGVNGDPLRFEGEFRGIELVENSYRSGDRVEIRLEVNDRMRDRSSNLLLNCTMPFCGTGGCLQRVSWTVVFQ